MIRGLRLAASSEAAVLQKDLFFNEAESLGGVVAHLLATVPNVDLLIVDDNSPDGTGTLADKMAGEDNRISVLHRSGKNGLGPAYLAGFEWGFARNYDYLIEMGVEGAVLRLSDGQEIAGNDLARVIEGARQFRRILDAFPTHYPRNILEQAAIAGAFDPGRADADLQAVADQVAKRLDLVAAEYEKGWTGRITQDHGIRLSRVLRGVEELRTLDGAVLRSGEARRLSTVAGQQREHYREPGRLVRKDREQMIHGPTDLLKSVLAEGEKGLSLQRYKGLGEMNPEQLWETTLDPDNRSLLRVEIAQADLADEIFTQLMGDVVEPRRDFIQENALNVANLDI